MIAPAAGPPGPEAIVVAFEAELRRHIRRRVPGPDADDVAQDALLRVYLGAERVRRGERITAWVYRVARSAIVDHYRRAGRPERPSAAAWDDDDALPEDPGLADGPGIDDDVVLAGLAACVAPFLAGLPAAQAEALRLTDLGGLSQVDAAERLGVPLPTLKARVQRGRRALRGAFDACCAFVVDGRGKVVEAHPRCGCGGGGEAACAGLGDGRDAGDGGDGGGERAPFRTALSGVVGFGGLPGRPAAGVEQAGVPTDRRLP